MRTNRSRTGLGDTRRLHNGERHHSLSRESGSVKHLRGRVATARTNVTNAVSDTSSTNTTNSTQSTIYLDTEPVETTQSQDDASLPLSDQQQMRQLLELLQKLFKPRIVLNDLFPCNPTQRPDPILIDGLLPCDPTQRPDPILIDDLFPCNPTQQPDPILIDDLFPCNPVPEPLATTVNAADLRQDSIITAEQIDNSIDPSEEAAFANTKVAKYFSSFKNAVSPEDQSLNRSALGFWRERAISWQEKSEQPGMQEGDDKFSAYKIHFFRSNLTGLENVMDQWLNVKDDTGMARANVAQIRSQIHKAEAAEKFWTGENKFWRQEHSSQYLEEDREAVKSIYGGIENLQSRYEATILGDSTENGLAISKELARLKGYLNELRIGGEDPKQGLIPYSGQVNPYEEQAFATFKIDFYHSNQAGLMNLHEQWSTVNDDTGFAKAQLEQIEEQQNLVTKATRFWTGEKHFWDRLGDAGQSEANASEIDQLLLQVTELENQMDQFLTLNDNSGTARHQRSKTMRQLNSTKAKIARLHTGF